MNDIPGIPAGDIPIIKAPTEQMAEAIARVNAAINMAIAEVDQLGSREEFDLSVVKLREAAMWATAGIANQARTG